MDLKGNIKSVKSIEYDAKEKFGEIAKEKITWDKYGNYPIVFNESGNQIENNIYPYGTLESKSIYKYDEKGNMIELNEYSSDGDLKNKSIFKYDDEGNPTDCDVYESDGSLENQIVWVFANNKRKEYKKLDSKGNIVSKFIYKYDDDDLKETIQFGLDGKLEKKYRFKYDNNGNQTESKEVSPDGNLIKLVTSIFDEDNNEIERNIYDSKEKLENKHTYKYDKQNKLIEHKNDDIDWGTFTYRYNEKGNLYEQVNFNLKKENTFNLKNTFKYDNVGNWIEKTEVKGIIPKTITERQIIYY